MSAPTAEDEHERLREASRTLARIAAQNSAAEATARTVAEARRRLAERQQEEPVGPDPAERWGRIAGRTLGILAAVALALYLAITYLL